MMERKRTWPAVVLGGFLGLVVAGIAALNVIIFTGMSEGYETPLPQVFRENFAVGLVVVGLLVVGPVLGARWMARRRG
jgi:hypothetical protein